MQNLSKISKASAPSTTISVSGLQGWADLPEGLLQSIIPLLGSFLELFAFAATCRSWRAAFYLYPSKSAFCAALPPLLIRPNIIVHAPHLTSSSADGSKLHTCQVIDLANQNTTLRCQIPEETFDTQCFAGSSYGQLIFSLRQDCLVIDVFTGAKVSPPRLPLFDDTYFYSGMLTAPLASSTSHLIICAASNQSSCQNFLFDWPVGSNSWSELQLIDSGIQQVVEFNGQFIAMDYYHRIYTLSLAPKLSLQKIEVSWWDDMDECPYLRPWLVVCDGMLLMVDDDIDLCHLSIEAPVNYKAFRLDMSTTPASWVQVAKLENHALFIGGDVRSPEFSCLSPGRWGGRSNCLYYARYSQAWSLHGLGDAAEADAVWDPSNDPDLWFKRDWYIQLQALWVYPSMFYSDAM